jgi:formylglycine-generating enzyme required for sulfatase activity
MKILILASNPRKDLNLDREIRDLKGVIEKSRDREQFEVEDELAVQVGNLQNLLLKHRPQIVHFCGHGSGKQGLVFESDGNGEQWVRTEALSELFRLYSQRVSVECVLLNACYSEEQADAIVQHSNYVIGMRQAISDEAAIAFSKGFYLTLGYGCSIEQAFEFGCNAIQLEISGSSKVLRSTSEQARKMQVEEVIETIPIPEDQKPILKKKRSLSSNADVIPAETRVALQVEIDKALDEEDTSQKQYRDRVREYLADHKLEIHERVFLNRFRAELGLSIEEADRILEAEWQPIEAAQQAYRALLKELLESDCDLVAPSIQTELKRFQTQKKLTDTETETLLQEAEEEHQERQRQGALSDRSEQAAYFVGELGGVALEMIAIPGGTFLMGSPESEPERDDDESPQHRVTVQPFFMGKVTVTQAQWKAVASLPKVKLDLKADPSEFKGSDRPVERVSWHEASEFCDRLSQKTGKPYRLPSEAEWEYACRAGTTTPFHFGETISTDLANYRGTDFDYQEKAYLGFYGMGKSGIYREATVSVGNFPSNAFGLYDMHGNVWEWCEDRLHENYEGAPIDGSAWTDGRLHIRLLRGGSWFRNPGYCRAAVRQFKSAGSRSNSIGFRVVFSAPRT